MKSPVALTAIILAAALAAPALAQEYGSITGIVTSANNVAIPDAVVTLWSIDCEPPAFVYLPDNPQYTSNFSSSLPGAYTFTNVPAGRYNVTAVWNGYWYYTTVEVNGGTATANIVIPEKIDITAFSTPTPVPTPRAYYTFVPIHASSPQPQAVARSPGFEALGVLLAAPIAALVRKWLRG